ncbi:MAG TPA: hypothetical protein VKM55_28285 [Candidatus Lokiarchaeia archaeon]|nr:hypothetical protein [Candidatus Lokiarchaeia archaeon]
MNRVDIYIITKDEGANLTKFNILGEYDQEKDQLISGFLAALNTFAKDLDFPDGVSLIRSGSLEARYAMGKRIFTVLIIDYSMPLGGMMTEPILSGMANEITERFEAQYEQQLIEGQKNKFYKSANFIEFNKEIEDIIAKYMQETFELYQKLVLIEAMYAKVPQKWCLPLLERASEGENIIPSLKDIPAQYQPQLKKAIDKVNSSAAPVWEIFQVPTTDFQPFD